MTEKGENTILISSTYKKNSRKNFPIIKENYQGKKHFTDDKNKAKEMNGFNVVFEKNGRMVPAVEKPDDP